ncbi:MAG: type III pantothenate kinase [Alphaproteobacteria bacterium]|nr:type III pantothenate kinase [Alphaproteobacteria bacterium]
MLLAIDVGNTNTVFALFDGSKMVGDWRQSTEAARTSDEYAVFLIPLFKCAGVEQKSIRAAIIGSVVPDANFHLLRLCRKYFDCEPMMIGSPAVDIGMKVEMDNPVEVGADRLINAVSGTASYKLPLIIIDFGTATTFDVVDEKGVYCGGVIAPGVNLSLQALHMAAAKLPLVALSRPPTIIGKNTKHAIQSGVFYGYAGLIEGTIKRIKAEFGKPMKVVATGGLASLFKDCIPAIDNIDADLTLRGLQIIYSRNNKKKNRKKKSK